MGNGGWQVGAERIEDGVPRIGWRRAPQWTMRCSYIVVPLSWPGLQAGDAGLLDAGLAP